MKNEEILAQINEASDLATELYDGIWEDAAMWMQTPNEILFRDSPLRAIANGDGHLVIKWLKDRLNRNTNE
jgi:hypothetical protein